MEMNIAEGTRVEKTPEKNVEEGKQICYKKFCSLPSSTYFQVRKELFWTE